MNVTAYLMGDPAARQVRQPTDEERARSGRYDIEPQRKISRGAPTSALGRQVRDMQPGDAIEMTHTQAGNFAHYMNREFGWAMTVRRVKNTDGSARAFLRRIR